MIDIAVIDTMVDLTSEVIDEKRMKFYHYDTNPSDKYGHGNAICGLFLEKKADYFIHLFVVDKNTKSLTIVNILNYILKKTNITYIAMSCGFMRLNALDKRKLEKVCLDLLEAKRLIVAANSNIENKAAYPSKFCTVLSVDHNKKIPKFYWDNCEIDKVNICWRKNLYMMDSSNSFYVPLVMDYIIENKMLDKVIERLMYENIY